MKPIVGNKAIEVVEKIGFKESSLSFPVVSVDDIGHLTQGDLEMHLTQIYKALQKTVLAVQSTTPTSTAGSALSDRLHILGYLYSIASCAEVTKKAHFFMCQNLPLFLHAN